jgi:hypothetical protein
MSDVKEHVYKETLELRDKMVKLWEFIESEQFNSLEYGMQALLNAQYGAMYAYYGILEARLESWKEGAE